MTEFPEFNWDEIVSLPAQDVGAGASGGKAAHEASSAESQKAERLRSLGLLAAGVAHDFNNLMTAVLGYNELARAQVAPDSAAGQYLTQASRGIRRASDLARQLLAYSGRGSTAVRSIDLSTMIREMESLLQVCLKGRGALKCDLATNLPEISADPIQLGQLVMNLVGNAADSLSGLAGLVQVRTGSVECNAEQFAGCFPHDSLPTAAGTYVFVEVADNGSGISVENLERIFEPFFSTKGESHSTRGIGLAIVMNAVRRHHGALRLQSTAQVGTTFTIYLPAFGQPDAALPA